MRSALLGIALLAALAAARAAPSAIEPPGQPTGDTDVVEYEKAYVAALKAYRGPRADVFLRAAQRVAALRPQHPPALYLLAGAQARAGAHDAALAQLTHLADLGLAFRADAEPAFAPLKDDPRFAAALARFAANLEPHGHAELVLEAKLPGDFIPESLAYDAARERWLLGSVRQRRIAAVDADGRVAELVSPASNGLYSALGMAAVGEDLIVASSALREMQGADERSVGRCAVHAFALADGAPRGRWPLSTGAVCALGDVLPLASSRVLASDSLGGGIYALNRATGRYAAVLAPGQLRSPQGMVVLDWQRIAIADYEAGLYALRAELGPLTAQPKGGPSSVTRTRRRTTVELEPLASAESAALYGIDGLYAHRDTLIAIQNGTRPQRILRLSLDPAKRRIERVEVLASNLPEWDEPTLGVVVGDAFYFVANSHWPRFGEDGKLPPAAELAPPRIMKIAL